MANLIPLINKNTYKFALFGIAKSGKTCILSALALPRFSNPKGFTCTWIEQVPGHEISTNSAETISAEDPFVLGASWLKESKEKLKKGDIPKANSNTDIMRFMFEFGSKENGSISVELIDYSGELLVAQSADLAIKLKQIMRDCDGLLVLAEVPKPDSESGDLAYGLDDLSKAFATLAKERDSGPKQEWPIALLFNKWDRRLDGKEAVTNIGQEEIDNFLSESPEPPHKSLVDKITNFIGNENIHCFPVSAFGSHNINQDGKEVPKTHGQMLKTINLEDGFIWLAERSDTLKVKVLQLKIGSVVYPL
jgi:GTPase SAR1 family protein